MSSVQLLVLAASLSAPAVAGEWSVSAVPAGHDRESVKTLARTLTMSARWLDLDPTWGVAVDADVHLARFGDRQVLRIRPLLDSPRGPVAVEGADRIVTLAGSRVIDVRVAAPLTAKGKFVLSEIQAVALAVAKTPASLLGAAQVKDTKGLGRPTWLVVDGVVRPAWRVRVPTLRIQDLTDLWVDAETGAVLRRALAAHSLDGVRP
jgi:hypothetical protein